MLKSQAIICSVITSWGRLLAAVGICDKMEVRLSNTGLLHPAIIDVMYVDVVLFVSGVAQRHVHHSPCHKSSRVEQYLFPRYCKETD